MKPISHLLFTVLLCGTFLAACGGGDGEEPAAAASPGGAGSGGAGSGGGQGSGGNQAPTISGSAPSQVMADSPYSFQPTANDPNDDVLTFDVSNLPPWASFDSSTGLMSGVPGQGDVGQYSNIRISVSDGTVSSTLSAFSVNVVTTATGRATLSWTPPTQNTDGSPLTDLDGFKVYWGMSDSDFSNSVTLDNEGLTTYMVEELTPGTWYFATSAYNALGVESNLSNVASKLIL